jgi:hypothetical protein
MFELYVWVILGLTGNVWAPESGPCMFAWKIGIIPTTPAVNVLDMKLA